MKIGHKLKNKRENKRFSQQEVADYLNVSQRTYLILRVINLSLR